MLFTLLFSLLFCGYSMFYFTLVVIDKILMFYGYKFFIIIVFCIDIMYCTFNNNNNKAGLRLRPGFCTVCDFAHARPIMLSILLVIGASVSEPPLVDSTDALSCMHDRYIDI